MALYVNLFIKKYFQKKKKMIFFCRMINFLLINNSTIKKISTLLIYFTKEITPMRVKFTQL